MKQTDVTFAEREAEYQGTVDFLIARFFRGRDWLAERVPAALKVAAIFIEMERLGYFSNHKGYAFRIDMKGSSAHIKVVEKND